MLRKRTVRTQSISNELTATVPSQRAAKTYGNRLKRAVPEEPQQQQQFEPRRQPMPMSTMHSAQSDRVPIMNYWQDELMDFSAQITRQAHFTLGRIASHFRGTGTKFDTKFRNHFMYISNNRILEAFESFLLGVSSDLKSDDYQMQWPNASPFVRPQIAIASQQPQQSIEPPPAKRKRIENTTERSTMNVVNEAAAVKASRITVIEKRSAAHPPKEVQQPSGRFVPQIIYHKKTTSTATASSSSTTTAGAAPTIMNTFKIMKVSSLRQPAASVTAATTDAAEKDPLSITSDDEQRASDPNRPTVISTPNNPGRITKLWLPLANAQSTPKQTLLRLQLNKSTAQNLAKNDAANSSLQCINKENVDNQAATSKADKQLSTSLPIAAPATPAMQTRSRGNAKQLFECDYKCGFTTPIHMNLMRHHFQHTATKVQACKICKKQFPSKKQLLVHMRENHQNLHTDLNYWELE